MSNDQQNTPSKGESNDAPRWKCDECERWLTKAEGGHIFTVCDQCHAVDVATKGHPDHERMLAAMLGRVEGGEPLAEVMEDYGYVRAQFAKATVIECEALHKEIATLKAMAAGSERRCANAEIENERLRAAIAIIALGAFENESAVETEARLIATALAAVSEAPDDR